MGNSCWYTYVSTLCIETLVWSSHELLFVFKNKFRTASGRAFVDEMTSAIAERQRYHFEVMNSLHAYEMNLFTTEISRFNLHFQCVRHSLSTILVLVFVFVFVFFFILGKHFITFVVIFRRISAYKIIRMTIGQNLLKWWIQIYYLDIFFYPGPLYIVHLSHWTNGESRFHRFSISFLFNLAFTQSTSQTNKQIK